MSDKKTYGPEYDYCGIIYIGGGSSWAYGATPKEAAVKAAKTCKSDWKSVFKFDKHQEFTVCIYDMKEHDGWYAQMGGVYDKETKAEIPLVKTIEVIV